METLQIEIPKGHEVESFDKESGVIKFKETPKDVTERIKTIDDVLRVNGISGMELKMWQAMLTEDEFNYRLLKLIAKTLNEGWTPNWDDQSERKYFPWFKMGSSGFRSDGYVDWYAGSSVGSRLCFKTRELAEYAGKQFTEIYKNHMLIK